MEKAIEGAFRMKNEINDDNKCPLKEERTSFDCSMKLYFPAE
jgi:hypothetical protein